jgi:hypothetical protein
MPENERPEVAGPGGPFEPIPAEPVEARGQEELVTEIGEARDEMARTAGALADRLNVKARVRDATHEQTQALRWDARRLAADLRGVRGQVAEKAPPQLVEVSTRVGRTIRQNPKAALGAAAGVVVLSVVLRRARH